MTKKILLAVLIAFCFSTTAKAQTCVRTKASEPCSSGLGVINVKDFNAVGDGIVDDTTAITNAVAAVVTAKMEGNSGIWGVSTISSGTEPTLYFPRGVYKITSAITLPTYIRVLGERSAIVAPDNVVIFTGVKYQTTIEGMTFRRGSKAIDIATSNADTTMIVVRDCEFIEQQDTSIITSNTSTKTQLVIEDSKFHLLTNVNSKAVDSYADYTTLRNVWVSAQGDSGVFVQHGGSPGVMFVENLVGVPGSGAGTGARWFDNYSSLHVFNSRLGGENNGIAALRNYAAVDYTGVVNQTEVVFQHNEIYHTESGYYPTFKFFDLPNVIRIKENFGADTTDGIEFASEIPVASLQYFNQFGLLDLDTFQTVNGLNINPEDTASAVNASYVQKGKNSTASGIVDLASHVLTIPIDSSSYGVAAGSTGSVTASLVANTDIHTNPLLTLTATADQSAAWRSFASATNGLSNGSYTLVTAFETNRPVAVKFVAPNVKIFKNFDIGHHVVNIPFFIDSSVSSEHEISAQFYGLTNGSVVKQSAYRIFSGTVQMNDIVMVAYGTAAPLSGGEFMAGDRLLATGAAADDIIGFRCTAKGSPGTWTTQQTGTGGGGGGSGDIDSVWSCSNGSCLALTATSSHSFDATLASRSAPFKVGASKPGTCTKGDTFADGTDPQLGTFWYCADTNRWAQMNTCVDIRQYGAVCDGSTDDSTAINNTVASLTAGGCVYIPDASCKMASTLDLRGKAGITFIGNRAATARVSSGTAQPHELLFSMTSGNAIDARGSNGLAFVGLNVTISSSTFVTTAGTAVFNFDQYYGPSPTPTSGATPTPAPTAIMADQTVIKDSTISAPLVSGSVCKMVSLDNSTGFSVENTQFTGCGYHVYGSTTTTRSTNNVNIKRSRFEKAEQWSLYNLGTGINIDGNYWSAQGYNQQHAHIWGSDTNMSTSGATFRGNWMGGNQNTHITEEPMIKLSATGLDISGNVMSGDNTSTGIELTGSPNLSSGITITGNWLAYNDPVIHVANGVVNGLTISGNYILGSGDADQYGIDLWGTTTEGLAVVSNRFENLTTGIQFPGSVMNNVQVVANTFLSVTNKFTGTVPNGLFTDGSGQAFGAFPTNNKFKTSAQNAVFGAGGTTWAIRNPGDTANAITYNASHPIIRSYGSWQWNNLAGTGQVANLNDGGGIDIGSNGLSGQPSGALGLYEAGVNGSSRIILKAPDSLSGDRTYILPYNSELVGDCITTDGFGHWSYASCNLNSVQAVWSCGAGDCSNLVAASGDTFDAGSSNSSKPCKRGTSLPGTCAEGECFQDTDSTGTELYLCTATNSWTKIPSESADLEPVFNVREFGAINDDGVDDTSAISSAITAACGAGPYGGIVYFPVGVWKYSNLTMNCPALRLVGQDEGNGSSKGSVLQGTDTTGTSISVGSSCTNCSIEKLAFQDSGTPYANTSILIDAAAGSYLTVSNLYMPAGSFYEGLRISDSIGKIDGVRAVVNSSTSGATAVHLIDTTNVFVENLRIAMETAGAVGVSIEMSGSATCASGNLCPDGNTLNNVNVTSSNVSTTGLWIHGANGTLYPRNTLITNSTFTGYASGTTPAIQIDSSRGFRATNVNAFGGKNAVLINGGEDITFENSTIGLSGEHAFVHNVNGATALVNTVVSDASQKTTNTWSGVYLTSSSRKFQFRGGSASGDKIVQGGANQKYGVEIQSGADTYLFRDLTTEGNQTANYYPSAWCPAIASAATINPTCLYHHITGTTTIQTITPPPIFGTLNLVMDSGASLGSSGNIAQALTTTANTPVKLEYDQTSAMWYNTGTTTHGTLAGLSADDHTQYVKNSGRSGGQSIVGGTGTGENLTLESTAHATHGMISLKGSMRVTSADGSTNQFGVSETDGSITSKASSILFGDTKAIYSFKNPDNSGNFLTRASGPHKTTHYGPFDFKDATGPIPFFSISSVGDLYIGPAGVVGAGNLARRFYFYEDAANGSDTVALKAPSSITNGSSFTLTLPGTTGSAGQCMKTDGSGALDWLTPVTAAAGSSTSIQFNSSNAFAGSNNFTWNDSTKVFTATGDATKSMVYDGGSGDLTLKKNAASTVSLLKLYNATATGSSDIYWELGDSSNTQHNAAWFGVYPDGTWTSGSSSTWDSKLLLSVAKDGSKYSVARMSTTEIMFPGAAGDTKSLMFDPVNGVTNARNDNNTTTLPLNIQNLQSSASSGWSVGIGYDMTDSGGTKRNAGRLLYRQKQLWNSGSSATWDGVFDIQGLVSSNLRNLASFDGDANTFSLWDSVGGSSFKLNLKVPTLAADANLTLPKLADTEVIDMSSVNPNTSTEGLLLPQTTDCSNAKGSGQVCWDTDGGMYIGNGFLAVKQSHVVNVKLLGLKTVGESGSASTNTSLLNAALTSGTTYYFPAGTYQFDTTAINLDGKSSIAFVGRETNGQGSSSWGAVLQWTGADSGSLITMKSSTRILFRGLTFAAPNGTTYSGKLIYASRSGWPTDLSGNDPGYISFYHCHFVDAAADSKTSIGIALYFTIFATVEDCSFAGFGYGIKGRNSVNESGTVTDTYHSNVASVVRTTFNDQAKAAILNPGDSWVIQNSTFESLTYRGCGSLGGGTYGDANCGAGTGFGSKWWPNPIKSEVNVKAQGLTISGNWFGDADDRADVSTRAWIDVNGEGITITGNHIDGCPNGTPYVTTCSTVGVRINDQTDGLSITGNHFRWIDTMVDFSSDPHTSLVVSGNGLEEVEKAYSTPIPALAPGYDIQPNSTHYTNNKANNPGVRQRFFAPYNIPPMLNTTGYFANDAVTGNLSKLHCLGFAAPTSVRTTLMATRVNTCTGNAGVCLYDKLGTTLLASATTGSCSNNQAISSTPTVSFLQGEDYIICYFASSATTEFMGNVYSPTPFATPAVGPDGIIAEWDFSTQESGKVLNGLGATASGSTCPSTTGTITSAYIRPASTVFAR